MDSPLPLSTEPLSYQPPLRVPTTAHVHRRASSATLVVRRQSSYSDTEDIATPQESHRILFPPESPKRQRRASTATLIVPRWTPHVVISPYGETAEPKSSLSLALDQSDSELECNVCLPDDMCMEKYKRTYFRPTAKDVTGPPSYLQAMQTTFKTRSLPAPPNGELQWMAYQNPEGSLYFREKTKRLLTFADLYNEKYMDGVTAVAQSILRKLETRDTNGLKDIEIVIGLSDYGEDDIVYGYYLVSWEVKSIFWLDPVEYSDITRDERVCTTETHLQTCLDMQFWTHVEIFPNHYIIPRDVLENLIRQVNFGIFDHVTSSTSIFPFDQEESCQILRCLEKIKPEHDPEGMWVMARCKSMIAKHAFLNCHGERGARTWRKDSILGKSIKSPRSMIFCCLTPLLFYMPSVYMEELEIVWIDQTVDSITWRKFITTLKRDWENSITPATVILSANVGFLAIQSIDTGNADRSFAQIASYISAVLSLFNYIVCQILTRHHRRSDTSWADQASDYLTRRNEQPFGGLESVAITFSLPIGLFIWSMITFLAALAYICFSNTSLVTRVAVGSFLSAMFVLTVILLYLDWEGHASENDKSILDHILPEFLRSSYARLRKRWHPPKFGFRWKPKSRRPRSGSSASSISSRGSDSTVVARI